MKDLFPLAALLISCVTFAAVQYPDLEEPATNQFAGCLEYYAAGNTGWCQVSTQTFNDVRLTNEEAGAFGVRGNVGSKAVMIAWNGGAIDRENLKMYFHGGGHNDYFGNEVYEFDIRSGQWARLNDPSPLTHYYWDDGRNGYCHVPDPAKYPNSAHTYDGIVFHPERKTLILLNSGLSTNCPAVPFGETEVDKSAVRNIFEFNPSQTEVRAGLEPLTWRNLGKHELGYSRSAFANGQLYLGSNTSIYKYDIVDNAAVQGDRVAGNALAGNGHLDRFGNLLFTYMQSGFAWQFDGEGYSEKVLGGYQKIPNSGGMACADSYCLFWSGEQNVTKYQDGKFEEIVEQQGPTGGDSRVYSKFQYIPQHDVFIGVANVNQPVWVYKVRQSGELQGGADQPEPQTPPSPFVPPAPPVPQRPPVPDLPPATASINVEAVGAFYSGLSLKKGVMTQPAIANGQGDCRKRWSDGSCKFAVLAGYGSGEMPVIEGSQPFGVPVAVNTDGISVVIDGSVVSLDLYESKPGPVMTEQRYRTVYNDILVLLYLKQWRGGERQATVVFENGYLNKKTGTKRYTATVKIGDYTETHTVDHFRNTRWVVEHGDNVRATQDRQSLLASGLVPSYTISPDAAPGSYQQYKPFEKGNHTASMGATGYQYQIGLLPGWDAAYIANPSAAAYDSVIANAYAIGSYGIAWRDVDTLQIVEPKKFPRWTLGGENKGGTSGVTRNGLTWERAHFPATGYLAYLLTGDQVHLDTLGHTAALCYLVQNWSYGGGDGEQRLDLGQIRGQAWCWRSIGVYTALTGDGGIKRRFDYNMRHYAAEIGKNQLGITRFKTAYGVGKIGPWQENFRVQTLGFLSDIEATTDPALTRLRDFNYKFIVGLMSCHPKAGSYTLRVADTTSTSISDYWTWPQIWQGVDCSVSPRPTATNYWANLLPSLSYAVKHNAAGAEEQWQSIKAADWFEGWMNRFSKTPVWGVVWKR